MSKRIWSVPALVILCTALIADANARSIRVDSGDWDLSGLISADTVQALGFNFGYFGFDATTAQIDVDGQVILSGGGMSAVLNPYFDALSMGGNTTRFQFGVTNAAFNTAGIDDGFRVTWQTFDAAGALLNEFQISLWSLTGGQSAFEFNYNSITAENAPQIGFNSSAGASFDLLATLGLNFGEYSGTGAAFNTPCSNPPDALACNNFYFNTMQFGPSVNVLPNLANGFFRQIDSNGGTAQGRYLFVSEPVNVPEPSTIALLALGLFALAALRRQRIHKVRATRRSTRHR